jgi:hypothetical protein
MASDIPVVRFCRHEDTMCTLSDASGSISLRRDGIGFKWWVDKTQPAVYDEPKSTGEKTSGGQATAVQRETVPHGLDCVDGVK